jgi:ArsR family transcriptional regulator, lead/cadmium/zinc/bismuth-responsive transcriptional repressor
MSSSDPIGKAPVPAPDCHPTDHTTRERTPLSDAAFVAAVKLFKALSDEQRLRTLELLTRGVSCVSEIAASFDEPLSTVSHRMKLLEQAGLVRRKRRGRHVDYGLADDHVVHLVRDALDHVTE